jgi:hypothetical protein
MEGNTPTLPSWSVARHPGLRAMFRWELRSILLPWTPATGPILSQGGLLQRLTPLVLCPLLGLSLGPRKISLEASEWPGGAQWVWSIGGALLISAALAVFLNRDALTGKPGASHVQRLLPVAPRSLRRAHIAARALAQAILLLLGTGLMLSAWAAVGAGLDALTPFAMWALAAPLLLLLAEGPALIGARLRPLLPHRSWAHELVAAVVSAVGAFHVANWSPPALFLVTLLAAGAAMYVTAWAALVPVVMGFRAVLRRALAARSDGQTPVEYGARDGHGDSLTWALFPELDAGRWARAAPAVGAAAVTVGLVLSVAVPLVLGAIARGEPGPGALARWANICQFGFPLAGILMSAVVWTGGFAPEGPTYGALLPIAVSRRWRANLGAGLVYAVSLTALGWAFGWLGYGVAGLLGDTARLPAGLSWMMVTAPALAMIVWAQAPILRNPLRVVRLGEWLWAALLLLVAVPVCAASLYLYQAVLGGQPHVWVPLTWAVAGLAVLASWLAVEPNRWRPGPDGAPTPAREAAVFATLAFSAVSCAFILAPVFAAFLFWQV